MKVHAFALSTNQQSESLADLLQRVSEHDIGDRLRLVGRTEVRLDRCQKSSKGIWFLDFVKLRFVHGPGRAHRKRPIEGFDFDEDEGFGEETAVLYDPTTEHMVVQYNHHGVKDNHIADYLSFFDSDKANSYSLLPKPDKTVDQRLANKTMHRKLSFRLAPRKIDREDREAGIPLSSILDATDQLDGQSVMVTVSAGREQKSALKHVKSQSLINWLRGQADQDADAVTQLHLTAKDDETSPSETLDLLDQRLVHEFEDLETGPDLRFPLEERWRALERAYNGWKDKFKRPASS